MRKDLVVAGTATVALFGILFAIDLFGVMYDFMHDRKDFGVRVLFAFAAASIAPVAWFVVRRWRDATQEVARRVAVQNEMQTLQRTLHETVERRTAELAASQRRASAAHQCLLDAIESMPDGFMLYDAEGRLVLRNARIEKIFPRTGLLLQPGTSRQEHLHWMARTGEIMDATGREKDWIAEHLAENDEGPRTFEMQLADDRWIEVHEHRTRNDGIVITYRDITASKSTALALAERERHLRLITDALPVLIAYIDIEKRLRFINRTGAQWYGSCPEALTGRYMRDLALPEAYDAMQDLFDQALKGEAVVSERILKYPDGRKRNVRVNYIPHFYARGRVKGFFALVEDITEQTRVEKQLAQSQRIGALGQLTGGVAHEFNNLLGIIIGNLELLEGALDGVSEPDADKFVATAMRAALRGVEQTQRLLSFARKQELRPTAVNLTAAMPDIATMIRTALAPNMMLTIDLADDLWPILVDPGQLEGALLNLAINARDAMPDGGTLTIRAANRHISTPTDVPVMQGTMPPGDYVVLSITDTGVGMSDEVLEYVFDPFFTTKPVGQGSGLGLSMVYGFVRQMGGHVDIDTAPGHGTTVHLFFRRAAIPRMCMACPVPAMDSAAPSSYRNAEPTPLPTPARRTGPLSQSG